VCPEIFELKFARFAPFGTRIKPPTFREQLREISVDVGSDFSVAALRLDYPRDGDEIVRYSRISN
jgi:hypothetical protein